MKVFWSWQSDRPAAVCRNVIQAAITIAIGELSSELQLDERDEEVELDHDTKGEAGMVAIADTILRKIAGAAAFVGDVTCVATSEGKGRQIPNPNVLIELGWAWAKLSHENIILVMNKAYGFKRPEHLPFDIRHRRAPISYYLPKGADQEAIDQTTAELAVAIKGALRQSLGDKLKSLEDGPGPSGRDHRDGDPARWFDEGSYLSHQPYERTGGKQYVKPLEGPALYVRMIPSGFFPRTPGATDVNRWMISDESRITPLGSWTYANGGLNEDGVLRYACGDGTRSIENWGKGDSAPVEIRTAVQWFRDTGELWSFDAFPQQWAGHFNHLNFLKEAKEFIERGLNFFQTFRFSGSIRIEAGGVFLTATKLPGRSTYGILDSAKASQSRKVWSRKAMWDFLSEVSSAFAEVYGTERCSAIDVELILCENFKKLIDENTIFHPPANSDPS